MAALQRLSGALLALEEESGDLAFTVGVRSVMAAGFAHYFAGVVVDGPQWRLDPYEIDRPAFKRWAASADF